MSISPPVKWLIGAGTAWLIAYPALFLIVWLLSFQSMFTGSIDSPLTGSLFSLAFPLHCLTFILQFVLLAFYLVHILRNQALSEGFKIGFSLSIVMLAYLGMPAYYYFFFWRDQPPRWVLAPHARQELSASSQRQGSGRASSLPKWLLAGFLASVTLAVLVAGVFTAASAVPMVVTLVRQGYYEPEPPTYEALSRYPGIDSLPYRPPTSDHFRHVSSYSQVRTWRYSKQTPIAIQGETLVVAGYFTDAEASRTSVDLLAVDTATGEIRWQGLCGDNYIAADAHRVYCASGSDPFAPVSLVASDIQTGAQFWETPLPFENAIGIEYLALVDGTLAVRTYNRGNGAFYSIDPGSGAILNAISEANSIVGMSRGQTIEWYGDSLVVRGQGGWTARLDTDSSTYDYQLGAPLILNDIVVVQNGYYAASPITALDRTDGHVLWRYAGNSASNLAVDGQSVFFVTDHGTLVVLDASSGELLSSLQFEPPLPDDYDFANDSLLVAAQGGLVVVYFEDARQLTVLEYRP